MQYKTSRHYLQAASGTVLRYDADVGRVDAGSDEPGEMVELDVSHLKITAQTRCDCECRSLQTPHSPNPHGNRGRGRGLTVHLYVRLGE